MWLDLRSLWEAPGALSLSIEPGSISISGQSSTFTTSLAQSTQGSVTFQGQSAAFTFNEAISTNGSITLGGQSITFTIGLAEGTQGSITFQGQAVTPSLGLAISTQGSITFDGQSVTLNLAGNLTLAIDTPGSVTFNGQTIAIQAPTQTTGPTPAGKAGRKKRYYIEIDGQQFQVNTAAEALQLLEKARDLAEISAERAAKLVLRKQLKRHRRPQIHLKPPSIETNAPITEQLVAIRSDIEAIYQDVAITQELAYLFKKQLQIEQDDEEDVILLLH